MMAGKNKKAALPFMGVSEGLDLVKKVWGVTGLPTLPSPASMAQFATRLPQTLPSMIAPTLDVEELDKRIADLRAVEQWMNLNLSMLRTTVQSLEVQRNTIATLKSFGGAVLSPGAEAPEPAAATAHWPYVEGQPLPKAPVSPFAPPPDFAEPTRRAAPVRKRRSPRAAAAAAAAALPLNPVAWWNTLQEQFTKIATAAAAEAQAAAEAEAAAKARTEATTPAVKGRLSPPAAAPRPRKNAARKRRRTVAPAD
jgi:hypothetical protein